MSSAIPISWSRAWSVILEGGREEGKRGRGREERREGGEKEGRGREEGEGRTLNYLFLYYYHSHYSITKTTQYRTPSDSALKFPLKTGEISDSCAP